MDVLMPKPHERALARRCHLWCWTPSSEPPEWENHSFIAGSLSPLGVIVAAATAVLSSAGNRRRREQAIRDAAPRWRWVASGAGRVIDRRLIITEPSGIVRAFDLGGALSIDGPAPGWIRLQFAGSPHPWAIQVI